MELNIEPLKIADTFREIEYSDQQTLGTHYEKRKCIVICLSQRP